MTARDHCEEGEYWDIVSLIDTLASREEEGELDVSVCETFVNMKLADNTVHEDPLYDGDTILYEGDTVLYDEEGDTAVANNSTVSVPHDQLSSLTNEQLKEKLESLGEQPGPINHLTRQVYISYLRKILDGTQPSGNHGYKGFKYELALCLNGTVDIPNLQKEEKMVFAEFRTAGQSKSFFNYFLMDPTTLSSTSTVSSTSIVSFSQFVESIFYVGKGKNARSHQHLKDAKHITKTKSNKVDRICSIWDSGEGVISFHVFNNISAGEAYCRESSIIDAIGRTNLTNIVRGHYHGTVSNWSSSQKRIFGVYLLHKAYQSFQIDPPQPIFPNDI